MGENIPWERNMERVMLREKKIRRTKLYLGYKISSYNTGKTHKIKCETS